MAKIKKEPLKVKIILEHPLQDNREQRRTIQRTRTSPSLATKKWTLGRVSGQVGILQGRLNRMKIGDTHFVSIRRSLGFLMSTADVLRHYR